MVHFFINPIRLIFPVIINNDYWVTFIMNNKIQRVDRTCEFENVRNFT